MKWYYLVALLVVGALFVLFMERWRRDTGGDRFQKAEEFSNYYRDFFIPYPKRYYIFKEKVPMIVRARNLGADFFDRDLPNYIAQSQNEVNEMLAFMDAVMKGWDKQTAADEKRKSVSFAGDLVLFNLLKQGQSIASSTQFNIAAGEILSSWDRAFRHRDSWLLAQARVSAAIAFLLPDVKPSTLDTKKIDRLFSEKPSKKKGQEEPPLSQEELLKQLALLDSALAKRVSAAVQQDLKNDKEFQQRRSVIELLVTSLTRVQREDYLPNMARLRRFIPYAKPQYITLDDQEKSVQIANDNTSINIKHFKYALFLQQLRKKLPQDFDYLMLLGDRHGMWHLPEKFIRWTIGVNDPFALLDKQRGALKLYMEEGAFSIVRRREDYFALTEKSATAEFQQKIAIAKESKESNAVRNIIREMRKKYPNTHYLVDMLNQEVRRVYSRPVDWRTGLEAEQYKSVVVIDNNPVLARMYGLSLFLSNKSQIEQFEKAFPKSVFVMLNNDDTLYVPKVSTNYFVSNQHLAEQEAERKKSADAFKNSQKKR
ncbi:hypothetical protein KAH37_08330 [bacterium]|nr:hypothetical protein [bacterium]